MWACGASMAPWYRRKRGERSGRVRPGVVHPVRPDTERMTNGLRPRTKSCGQGAFGSTNRQRGAQRAGVVVGALGVADLAAVLDEVDVGLVHLVRLEHAQEEVVGVVGGGLGADEPDPARDPLDVPVDRHERQAEREQQQHRGGLLADAVDGGQPVARLERGHVAEELERVVAAFLADVAQRGLDPRRLLVAEPARPDRLDQLGERRELDGRPVGRDARRAGRRRPSRRPGCAPRPRRRPGTLARSASNATSAFVSALFWVRMVRISSLVGSSRRCQAGRP